MHKAAVDRGLNVVSLLCTHWHFDHSGGNRTLKRLLPGLEVVSGETDAARTPCVTRRVADLEEWNVGRLTVRAHHVPGHTLGSTIFEVASPLTTTYLLLTMTLLTNYLLPCSIIFEVASRADATIAPVAFTGDTLFCGGCGALFEASVPTLCCALCALC